jgi:hypothetical protein
VANTDLELLQGTLDLLILKTLTWGPHGYAIASWIRDATQQRLQIEDAPCTLPPRMEKSVDRSRWGFPTTTAGEYYQPAGRGAGGREAVDGEQSAVFQVLRLTDANDSPFGLRRLLRIVNGAATVDARSTTSCVSTSKRGEGARDRRDTRDAAGRAALDSSPRTTHAIDRARRKGTCADGRACQDSTR